jgi:short-subunit dehydrogenase
MHKMNHLHRLNETYKAGMLQMNILMPTYLCDHYGQKMIARGKGCIFLTGALNYTMAIEKDSIFQGSKAYISAFAESLWLEYRRFGVDVCTGLISGIEGSESYETKSSELSRKLLHYSGGSMQADFIVQKCLQDIEKGKSYAIPDYLFPVSKIIYLFIAINKVLRSRRYARMLNHLLHKVLNGKGASE